MNFRKLLILTFLIGIFAGISLAQEKITDVKINVLPVSAEIRPQETAVVQIQFFGEKKKGFFDRIFDDQTKEGQLQLNDWKAKVENSSGWLSKPFLLQDQGERTKSGLDNFIRQGLSSVSAKDSVLYTAPEKAGKYQIKFTRGEISKEVSITVSNSAKSSKPAESPNFSSDQKSVDPYFAWLNITRRLSRRKPGLNQKRTILPGLITTGTGKAMTIGKIYKKVRRRRLFITLSWKPKRIGF